MRKLLSVFLAGVMLVGGALACDRGEVRSIVEQYGSLPKGVTVEGSGLGIGPVRSLQYQKESNSFLINGSLKYTVPVTFKELLDIVSALRLNELIGVSVKLNNELIVYGKLNRRSPAAKKLEATDNFFRAIVYGETDLLRGYRLPGEYKVKKTRNRERASVIYVNFDSFRFAKEGGNIVPAGLNMKVMLIPMAKYTAPDGGYMPDYDALEKGDFQPEDKANANHIDANKAAYQSMEIVKESIAVGQATAFLRHLRDCGISLEKLEKAIETGNGVILKGNPGQTDEQEVAAKAKELQEQVYKENLQRVLALDAKYASDNPAKLTRETVNDGSYVAFRERYLANVKEIDLHNTPGNFAEAYKAYGDAWVQTLEWMKKQKIGETKEALQEFVAEHAPYRKLLSQTWGKCKEIAAGYGVSPK